MATIILAPRADGRHDHDGMRDMLARHPGAAARLRDDQHIEIDTDPTAPPAAQSRIVSVTDFRRRFTDDELAAIAGNSHAGVKVLLLKLQTSLELDLDDAAVRAGLELLAGRGLIRRERIEELLA